MLIAVNLDTWRKRRPSPGQGRNEIEKAYKSEADRRRAPSFVNQRASQTFRGLHDHSRTALPYKLYQHFKRNLGKVIRRRHSPIEISRHFAKHLGKLTTPTLSVRAAPRCNTSMSTDSRRARSMLEGPEEKGEFKSGTRKKWISGFTL